MKRISLFLAAAGTISFLAGSVTADAAEKDGVALAIVYDTSGSMKEPVRDTNGRQTPKYQIANRALTAVVSKIENYARKQADGERAIQAGLFVFQGNSARAAVPFGPFDAAAMKNWAERFRSPSGSTPLGNALSVAGKAVLNSPFTRKHVLIVTDGMNTSGPQPSITLPRLRQEAGQKGAGISVHFVAFDVDAKVFDPVKKLDATVVSAADEKQLNTQLDFIMQKKILLEDEEPTK